MIITLVIEVWAAVDLDQIQLVISIKKEVHCKQFEEPQGSGTAGEEELKQTLDNAFDVAIVVLVTNLLEV